MRIYWRALQHINYGQCHLYNQDGSINGRNTKNKATREPVARGSKDHSNMFMSSLAAAEYARNPTNLGFTLGQLMQSSVSWTTLFRWVMFMFSKRKRFTINMYPPKPFTIRSFPATFIYHHEREHFRLSLETKVTLACGGVCPMTTLRHHVNTRLAAWDSKGVWHNFVLDT